MQIDITIPHPEKWPYWAKLGDLKPFQGSLKALPPENFEKLKKQILEGFAFPIYVWINDGNHYIIDGHQRTATLIRLRDQGYEVPDLPIVPVKAKDYNEAKIRVLQAASQYGKVDKEGYLDFIKDIDVDGFDLNFDLPDVDFDLDLPSEDESEGTEGNTDPDEVPEVDDNPYGVERGDVWLLGDHRLKCGDSTDESDVADLMDGEKIDLLITDLPYGVSYADKNNFLNSIDKGNRIQNEIKNDHINPDELKDFCKSIFTNINKFMNNPSSYYSFMPQGGEQMMMMMMALKESGFQVKHELIWVKNNHVLGRVDYAYKHEPICYGWPEKTTHKFYAKDFKTSIFEFNKPTSSKLHPTMKPIDILEELIQNSSNKNMTVFDPTIGSGSTLIACEKTGRKCYGMEIDPHYVSVIIKRWEDFTGKKAVKL